MTLHVPYRQAKMKLEQWGIFDDVQTLLMEYFHKVLRTTHSKELELEKCDVPHIFDDAIKIKFGKPVMHTFQNHGFDTITATAVYDTIMVFYTPQNALKANLFIDTKIGDAFVIESALHQTTFELGKYYIGDVLSLHYFELETPPIYHMALYTAIQLEYIQAGEPNNYGTPVKHDPKKYWSRRSYDASYTV